MLAGSLLGLFSCGVSTRPSRPGTTSMLPARTPDGLVSIPWTFAGAHRDAVVVRYNDSDCGFSFAHTAAVETLSLIHI